MFKAFIGILVIFLAFSGADAQFVFPRPEYHSHSRDVYSEDPFIVHYRKEFFAVFAGDFPRFENAYAEIKTKVKRNPKDARALVWLGNGQTVEAGILRNLGKTKAAQELLEYSRVTLDRAVSLSPKDPNIYMMRAATLYVQGQYWPTAEVPRAVWEELRDDCLHFIEFLGPKIKSVSVHVRGEAYGELGIAYARLGERDKARTAFRKVIELNPGTDYSERAQSEIERLTPK